MRTDIKELLASFSLGLTALLLFAEYQSARTDQLRPAPLTEAIASTEAERLPKDWPRTQAQAPTTRMQSSGSTEVVVAVIDTGCDTLHPALLSSIWRNPGEDGLDFYGRPKASNGIDDDANGYTDDVMGWNFVDANSDVEDLHGHGTHVAGLIAPRAEGNVRLMILKYYDTQSSGLNNLSNTVAAIRYAVQMGAKIINYSGGGVIRSREEEAALAWAAAEGVLVVAAAGNDGLNSDFHHFYPAGYDLPNILAVAAMDANQRLLRMSNYGRASVDIAAPGKNLYSTLPNQLYGFMSGTSQATAVVTGRAAEILAEADGRLTPQEQIQTLFHQVERLPHLAQKVRSGGVVQTPVGLFARPIDTKFVHREDHSTSTRRHPAQVLEPNEITLADQPRPSQN